MVFSAGKFVQITAILAKLHQLSRVPTEGACMPLEPEFVTGMKAHLEGAPEVLRSLELPMTAMHVEKLVRLLDNERTTMIDFGPACGETHERLRDECKLATWLKFPNERARYYMEPVAALDLQPIGAKFPGVVSDLWEGSVCYSLDRGTACVLHTVRSLEVAVKALWRSLGQPDPSEPKGWGDYAKWSRDYIQNLKKEPRPPDWPSKRGFYVECDGGLQAVYKAWRCPAMHEPERVYDGPQAKEILDAVRGLIGRLAEHIDEAGNYVP